MESNTIFKNTEAKVTFYSNIIARLEFTTYFLYVMVPVLRIFQATYYGTTVIADSNIGFFQDL